MNLSSIPQEEFERLQRIIDVDKWLASERAGYDLCGSMEWCPLCIKAERHPCAKAKFRLQLQNALQEEVAAAGDPAREESAQETYHEAPAQQSAESARHISAEPAQEVEEEFAEVSAGQASEESGEEFVDVYEEPAEKLAEEASEPRFTAEDERQAERDAAQEVAQAAEEFAAKMYMMFITKISLDLWMRILLAGNMRCL